MEYDDKSSEILIFPNGIRALQSSLFLVFNFGHHQFLLSFHMKCLLLEDFYTKFWLQNVCFCCMLWWCWMFCHIVTANDDLDDVSPYWSMLECCH